MDELSLIEQLPWIQENIQRFEERKELTNQRVRARKYGLSLEELSKFLQEHDNKCDICGSTERLSIDHDHDCCPTSESCGKCVRGLLCFRCNWMLGWAKDDIDLLRRAMSYLMNT